MALSPRIDISETDTELRIEVELPGIDEKDVEVVLGHGRLTIKGEKAAEGGAEEGLPHGGTFLRIVRPFDRAAVRGGSRSGGGGVRQGVLTVTVPKPPEVKAKEKKIRSAKADRPSCSYVGEQVPCDLARTLSIR